MKLNTILPWYTLLLIVLFCAALMMREGFTTSPATFANDISNKKVFVLFYTTSCSHCTQLKPVWDKAEAAASDKMVSINVSDQTNPVVQALTKKYNITSYPYMVIMDNGTVTDTYNGGRSESDLANYIKAQFGSNDAGLGGPGL